MQAASCIDARQGFTGAITISNAQFTDNGLAFTNSTTVNRPPVNIDCLTFSSSSSCSIVVQNTTFAGNHGGGAMDVSCAFGVSTIVFTSCVFTNNTKITSGAAISAITMSSVRIFSSVFEDNHAWTGSGGAIYVDTSDDIGYNIDAYLLIEVCVSKLALTRSHMCGLMVFSTSPHTLHVCSVCGFVHSLTVWTWRIKRAL